MSGLAGAPIEPEVVAVDDAGLARGVVGTGRGASGLVAEVRSGDVLRTLGLGAPRPAAQRLMFPFDLGMATLDGSPPVPFVAHLCARRRGWAGEFAVVMNGAWVGEWYLGPRAHPNDGLLDVTVGRLALRQRLAARTRARTGSHLPHPGLRTARVASWEHRFARPTPVYLDGQRIGLCRHLGVRVSPDHFYLIA